ncbi:MAG TPA: D-aminoacyl-tRNA deacylase [Steroidobacteraceae bacterium]|nr:D-aminoacyl-tRNA deacylase [Steroidobacteraceae bacterium]
MRIPGTIGQACLHEPLVPLPLFHQLPWIGEARNLILFFHIPGRRGQYCVAEFSIYDVSAQPGVCKFHNQDPHGLVGDSSHFRRPAACKATKPAPLIAKFPRPVDCEGQNYPQSRATGTMARRASTGVAMIVLLQRVSSARVRVNGRVVGAIDRGVLSLVAVQQGDTATEADRLLERLLNYRIFPDSDGKMNLSVRDIRGGLLVVSQFTLAADTRKGNRPGFSRAAAPEEGRRLFDHFVDRARAEHGQVATGEFGADMQVELVNDGPVTFWLEVAPPVSA